MNNSSIKRVPIPVALLLISLALPVELSFYIGELLITPSRLVLILMSLPVVYRFINKGNLRKTDFLLFGFVFWVFLSFTYNHGVVKAIESAGVLSLEMVIGYLVARVYLTDLGKLIATIKLLVLIVALILPLVVIESVTGSHFIHDFFRSLTGFQYRAFDEVRLGYTRASGPFSHPILLGVFSSSLIGLVWYGFSKEAGNRMLLRVGILVATTLVSLSSAPILLLLFQFFAIVWNRLTRKIRLKWHVVAASFVSVYVFLLFWSSSSPLMVIMSRITLDPGTSYYRRLIWEHGSAEVLRHPIFGLGRNDWSRPVWMISDSIDNFWLKIAMFYGLPSLILLAFCVCLLIFTVVRAMKKSDVPENFGLVCRGWIVSMAAFCLIGCTVDFFGTVHVYFYFFIGIGASLIGIRNKLG